MVLHWVRSAGGRALVAGLSLLLLVVIAGCARTPPLNGKLVFSRMNDVYLMDGSLKARQLTNVGSAFAQDPTWSPDGQQIAFSLIKTSADGKSLPTGEIHVISADGGESRPLVKAQHQGEVLIWPTWSPDSRALYFDAIVPQVQDGRVVGEDREIARVDLATGSRTSITRDAMQAAVPPDGAKVAFVRVQGNRQGLVVAQPDGSGAREIAGQVEGFDQIFAPCFSPDGQWIAFAAVGGRKAERAPAPTDSLRALARLLAGSPRLAEAHGLPWDLWLVGADGSGLRRLTDLAEDQLSAAWSTDGKRIVFQGEQGLYLIEVGGGKPARLTNDAGFGRLDWLDR